MLCTHSEASDEEQHTDLGSTQGNGNRIGRGGDGSYHGRVLQEPSPSSLHDRLAMHLAKMEYLAGRVVRDT
jgi:hypothetical protein